MTLSATATAAESSPCSLHEAVKTLEFERKLASASASSAETDSSTEEEEPEFEATWTHEVLSTSPCPPPSLAKPELPPVEICFSASGGAFVYQMGVAAYMQDHFDLSDCHFSGCSGGSWAATLLASGTSVHEAWAVIRRTQARLVESPRWYSGYGRYSAIIAETIQELWRDDPTVCQRARARHLSIAVTKLPTFTPARHTAWESLEDLTASILASCLIPFALTGKPCLSHRGEWYIDGCVTNFTGGKRDDYSTWTGLVGYAARLAFAPVRAVSSTVAKYALPSSVSALVASRASSASAREQPRSFVVKPFMWRAQGVTAYHLSVNVDAHQQRFDDGYADALAHRAELEALLPRLPSPRAAH